MSQVTVPKAQAKATRLTNNILAGSGAAPVMECGMFNDRNAPIIAFNDVFHRQGGLTGPLHRSDRRERKHLH